MSDNNDKNKDLESALLAGYNMNDRKSGHHIRSTRDTVLKLLNECLESFVIIGYDVNGKEVVITHSKTPMSKKALAPLIMEYLMENSTPFR